jgi:hypothetical protein
MVVLCVMHDTETGFTGFLEKFDCNLVCAWLEVARCKLYGNQCISICVYVDGN